MADYIRDKCIIIKVIPVKEADLLVKVISSEMGFVTAFARGALKSKKRFGGGVLEPFHFIECSFQKNEKIYIQEAKLLEDFQLIRKEYDRVMLGFEFLSYFDRLNTENLDTKNLFYLLGHTLRALTQTQNLPLLEVQFFAKFLFDQGVLDIQEEDSTFCRYIGARYDSFEVDPAIIARDRTRLLSQIKSYLNLN
jgi:DNA repair protein RecO (recombination protein O)